MKWHSTIGPLYLWVLHAQIQLRLVESVNVEPMDTEDQLYSAICYIHGSHNDFVPSVSLYKYVGI